MEAKGMDNIGKPVDYLHREAGNDMLRDHVGISSSGDRFSCVQSVADLIEKDRPHEAMRPVSYTHLTLPTICSV